MISRSVAESGDISQPLAHLNSRQTRIALLVLLCLSISACAPLARPQPAGVNSPAVTASPASFATATRLESPTPAPTLAAPAPTRAPATALPVTATPLACWREPGRVITGTLATDLLPAPLQYRVYTPPCYEVQVERRYPVIYLIHGQSFNDDQWQRLEVPETADAMIRGGEAAPFMVVMPRDNNCCAQPSNDRFGEAVIQKLIPTIDTRYRTFSDRDHRAVGGLSRGAGWAVHLALTHPDLFSSLGAHSLAVLQEDAPRLRTWLTNIPPAELPRIYLDLGDKDRPEISDSARWFENMLMEKHIAHDFYLFVGYHDETYWRGHVVNYLRWYTLPWN